MEKIKLFLISEKGKDLLIFLIIILVGLSSFGLGRLSQKESSQGLKIKYQDQEIGLMSPKSSLEGFLTTVDNSPKNEEKAVAGEYFASSRGTKFYPIDCPAGKNIKDENRIYFNTFSEAEKAGYQLSSSCE